MTRQALTYVDLELRTCGLVYGEGSCAAAIGVTGEQKCFNTRATCQDRVNFDLQEEPGGAVEYLYTATAPTPASATVEFTGVTIGAGNSMAVSISARRAAGAITLVSATIGGEPADILVQQGAGGVMSAVIYAEGPTDATADVVLSFSAQPSQVAIGIWRLANAIPVAGVVASSNTKPSPSTTIDGNKNGSVIAAVASYLQSTTAWTGATEQIDSAVSAMNYSFASHGFSADEAARLVTATQTNAARSAPTVVSTSVTSGPTATLAMSGVANDIAIYAIETPEEDVVAAAGGATLIDSINTNITDGVAGNNKVTLFWKRFTSTSLSETFNTTIINNHMYVRGIVIRGANPYSSPIGQIVKAARATATASSMVIPALTTTIANSLVMDFLGRGDDSTTAVISSWSNGTLTSQSALFDGGTTEGNGGGVACNVGVQGSIGSTGTTTANLARSVYPSGIKISVIPTDNSDALASMAVAAFDWTRPIRETRATMRFAKAADYRPQDIEAIASIMEEGVKVTPARIKPGEDLGSRAILRVSFEDHPHTDTGPGLDPYFAERAYNPFKRGTFFSKLRARQPYLKGEEMVLRQGFVGQTLEEMEASLFVVESFDGPTIDGVYTVTAHDPLKMLDGDRAQCPRVNRGRLSADLTNVATSFTIIPAGLGDDEYATSGWMNLGGNEMVSFTRVADTFTIVRAQMGTVAVAHTAGDRVQQAARFDSLDPAVIIHELMTEFAGVPQDWLPLDDWLAETGGYLQRVFDATIAEPTAVGKLVGELMEQAGLSIWWDEIGREVRLRVLRPISTDATLFDESLMVRQSIGIREQPDKRFSEVWIHFGQISPLGGEDPDNYPTVSVTTNLEAEDNYQSSKIKKIYSRWIARGGRTAADRVGRIVLARYVNPPRLFTYSLMRGAQGDPVLGSGYLVSHRSLQDATGAVAPEPVQIVSLKRGSAQFEVTAEGFSYDLGPDVGDRQVTITADTYGVNLRDWHDDQYPDPTPGDTVTCIIETQARVGGTTSLPAFSIGTWPTQAATGNRTSGSPVISGLSVDATTLLATGILVKGTGIPAGARVLSVDSASQVTLTANASSGAGTSTALTFYTVNIVVENLGLISGIGGPGGKGANEGGNEGSGGKNGGPGGTGLYSRYPFKYRDAGAKTQGGGGGGAGGSCANFDDHRGGGGGGGAGFPGGAAGIGPGSGEDGTAGTITAGGNYGRSFTSSTFWTAPSLKASIHGGAGGTPGVAGDNDVGGYDVSGGSPGAAGVCIDGISYLTQDGAAGTRLGSQIN